MKVSIYYSEFDRPYDGHTLAPTFEQIKRIVSQEPDESYAEKDTKTSKVPPESFSLAKSEASSTL
jgi:hypothetical protein